MGAGEAVATVDRLDLEALIGGRDELGLERLLLGILLSTSFRTPAIVAAPASRICDSERKRTASWPNAACNESAQPSYSLSRRLNRCQRASVSFRFLSAASVSSNRSILSRSSSASSSDSFSMYVSCLPFLTR